MPGAKRPSVRASSDAGRKTGGLRGGEYAGASVAVTAAAVGASAPDDPAELALNGLPQFEQNRPAPTSEPHCWHGSTCNGPTGEDLISLLESATSFHLKQRTVDPGV